jgi:hypothetical protein
VPVRVTQVDRLADEVIGKSHESHAVACRVCKPAGELPALRNKKREVVEARVTEGGLGPLLFYEDEQLAITSSK